MSNLFGSDLPYFRDGTSQASRRLAALDPDHFRMDERSIEDLLAFAQKLGKALIYYNTDNEAQGDWSAFLAGDPAEMAAFLEDPTAFDHLPEKKARFSRPHLALFLTFLKLLQGVQEEINQLTRRQLDFYYQQALGFVKKAAVPDQVHVLAQLRPKVPEVLVPAGTLLAAGKDEAGNSIQYRIEEDLVANQVQIARLMSLHVEKEVVDIPLLRFRGDKEKLADRGLLSILQLVYRQPGTADTLRVFPVDAFPGLPFDQGDIIGSLDAFRELITRDLRTPVGYFQRILADYHLWYAESNWQGGAEPGINDYLQRFFARKNSPADGMLPVADPRNFDANFAAALGFTPTGERGDGTNAFDGLRAVDDVYDLYRRFLRERAEPDEDLVGFILEYFGSEADFDQFMRLRTAGLAALQRVHRQLWEVGDRNPDIVEPGHLGFSGHLAYEEHKTLANAFSVTLHLDIDLDDSYLFAVEKRLQAVEDYLGMTAADYYFIRDLYRYDHSAADVPAWKWARADRLLEKAYAAYYASLTPSEQAALPDQPKIQYWKNCYRAPDATQLTVSDLNKNAKYTRWKTFGTVPSATNDSKLLHAAEIGWSLYSPALALSEGRRQLTLTLRFAAASFAAQRPTLAKYLRNWTAEDEEQGPYPFRLDFSTEKGWMAFAQWDTFEISESAPTIRLAVTVTEEADPLMRPADETFRQPWPGLRLVVTTEELVYTDDLTGKAYPTSVYDLFKGLTLEKTELAINVSGLNSLMVQVSNGLVKPKKPFAPFGNRPAVGDRFYLTHPEVARQKLDSVAVRLAWKNLPADGLATYYKPYQTLTSQLDGVAEIELGTHSFTAELHLIEGHRRMAIPLRDTELFSADQSPKSLVSASMPAVFPPNAVPYAPLPRASLGRDVTGSDRYLELELTPQDFLHGRYRNLLDQQAAAVGSKSTVASAKSAELSAAIIAESAETESTARDDLRGVQDEIQQLSIALPEPFTPILEGVSLGYTTEVVVDWVEQTATPDTRAFHLEPFGERPLSVAGHAIPFLPEVTAEGTLYIGLENLEPPQEVSLLFQMAEGSADPELLSSPLDWSYLSNDQWQPLSDRDLRGEATGGLLSSGLVKVYLSAHATNDNLRLPSGLHWLRIQARNHPASHSDCIAIHTQALAAVLHENGEPTVRETPVLPPERIQKPTEPIRGITGFRQPYASYFGKAPEADGGWYTRVSERLRHKDRVLTLWDYERITLEHFPDVYRVKALPGELFRQDDPPGTVRVIVIPDIRRRPSFDPFEPRVPIARIQQIQAVLQDHAPPFARVRVQNPRFLHLKVRVGVRFYDQNNFGFYAEQLDRDIQEFLTPWAFDHTEEIAFGGKIHPSALVDFIEKRPYVDYLEEPELRLLRKDIDGVWRVLEHQPRDAEGLLAVTEPDVIFVSAPRHLIESLPLGTSDPARARTGIGYGIIAFDFQIQ